MSGTVTLTGKAGPGLTVTATVFNDVASVRIDMVNNLITILKNDGTTVPPISVAAATTVTSTKSGSTWTLTIS